MSATIYSEIVDLDQLVPRVVDIDCENRDIDRLIPYVFRHSHFAGEGCTDDWPSNDCLFDRFFHVLDQYRTKLSNSVPDLVHTSEAVNTITLPRANWKVPQRQDSSDLIRLQGMLLLSLMRTIYLKMEGIAEQPLRFDFPVVHDRQKYIIGGTRYTARAEGSVTVKLGDEPPVISYPAWFEGQEWKDFLGEVLSVMLGQLAKNIRKDYRDHEAFVVGFHGLSVYIARGLFTTDLITRVQSQGCSENDRFELKFTRGYNMCIREDWLQAMRALTRLFRYLLARHAGGTTHG